MAWPSGGYVIKTGIIGIIGINGISAFKAIKAIIYVQIINQKKQETTLQKLGKKVSKTTLKSNGKKFKISIRSEICLTANLSKIYSARTNYQGKPMKISLVQLKSP